MTTRRTRTRATSQGPWDVFEPWGAAEEEAPSRGEGPSGDEPAEEEASRGEDSEASEEAPGVDGAAVPEEDSEPVAPPASTVRVVAGRQLQAPRPVAALARPSPSGAAEAPPGSVGEEPADHRRVTGEGAPASNGDSAEVDAPADHGIRAPGLPSTAAGEEVPWALSSREMDPEALDAPLPGPDDPDIPWDPSERTVQPVALPPDEPADGAGSAEPPDPGEDPAGFVRTTGVPILERLIRRLAISGHECTIQDLLDLPERPALRLLLWPRPGLWEESPDRTRATLEAEVRTGDAPSVSVRYWHGKEASAPVHLADLPPELLTEDWLRERMLDGLRSVLEEH